MAFAVALVFLIIGVMFFVLFFYPAMQKKNKLRLRLIKIKNLDFKLKEAPKAEGAENQQAEALEKFAIFKRLAGLIGNLFIFESYKKKLEKKLLMAGLLIKPNEFILLNMITLIIGVAFGVIFKKPWLFILLSFLGYYIPGFIINGKKKKRTKIFNQQLGESLSLMSNSLKAGYSFMQAVDLIAKETDPPIADEFGRVVKESSLGMSIEDALEGILSRVESDDLDLVITAVQIQRQIGGNLSEILDNINYTIRERTKMQGKIKALTAQGRASGYIIAGLPFVIALILYALVPDIMSLLWKDKLGLVLIGVGLFMQFIGIMVIRKVLAIET